MRLSKFLVSLVALVSTIPAFLHPSAAQSQQSCSATPVCDASKSRWRPSGKLNWSIDYSINFASGVFSGLKTDDVFVTPLAVVEQAAKATPASQSPNAIQKLKCERKQKLICYTNCGAYEKGHWNESLLNAQRAKILGKPLDGYPAERWLDITQRPLMERLIKDKFARAAEVGCDALLCDNVEAWITGLDGKNDQIHALYREQGVKAVQKLAASSVKSRTGLYISYQDQLSFNRMLAREAHDQCMAIGLLNDVYQIRELVEDFDFALNEQCHHCGWCDLYRPFVDAKKPVLHLEFHDNENFCRPGSPPIAEICQATQRNNLTTFSTLKRAASSKLDQPDTPQRCE